MELSDDGYNPASEFFGAGRAFRLGEMTYYQFYLRALVSSAIRQKSWYFDDDVCLRKCAPTSLVTASPRRLGLHVVDCGPLVQWSRREAAQRAALGAVCLRNHCRYRVCARSQAYLFRTVNQ
jgi:hypothetical protein